VTVRILHITTSLSDGGAEATLFRIIRFTPAIEHRVVTLTSGGRYVAELRELGVEVVILDFKSPVKAISSSLRLHRLIANFRPDAIQSWMYHANLATGLVGLFRNSPPIFWGIRNSVLVPGVNPWHTRLASWLCARLSSRVPESIICAGKKAKEVHESMGYESKKLLVIPNGVDTDTFAPNLFESNKLRQSLDIPSDEFLIGAVGRFTPEKDHENLLAALSKLSRFGVKFRCLFVGRGMDSSNLQMTESAVAHGLLGVVEFLGPRKDIENVFPALDVHVTSSSSEAFPNVIAESMACGTPCVTTNVGDASAIVGASGFVVKASDAQALAEGLFAAYDARLDRVRWKELQNSARRRIQERYGMTRMTNSYLKIWRSPSGKTSQ
jgi:glycosyltransferase involved in cell wall biosynthesis